MVQPERFQRCIWCGNVEGKMAEDHIFPRSLGGTKQLVVPSCYTCNDAISKAEGEVSRRSVFSLYRIDKGPPPRNKSRPDSGSVEAKYVLVKDWMGGYNEIALRTKSDPIPLPCIELDVSAFNSHIIDQADRVICRARGSRPEDVDGLVEAILSVVKGPPDESGLLGEVNVELLSEFDAKIAADPDFWPRVFLDIRGKMKIRARDGEEAKQLIHLLVALAQRGAFKDHSRWATGEVQADTPHFFCLEYDEHALMRVVAKITYATAYRYALPIILESESLLAVRRFVLGEQNDNTVLPVRQISSAESIKEWPDHHIVLIDSNIDKLQRIVLLYGACFIIDLGKNPLPSIFDRPIVAMSRRDGTHTYFATDEESEIVAETLRHCVKKIVAESNSGRHEIDSNETDGMQT